jgi:hypothetical protein
MWVSVIIVLEWVGIVCGVVVKGLVLSIAEAEGGVAIGNVLEEGALCV